MIGINEILQWKHEYGDIFQIEVQGIHYIFRPIGREEYKQIVLMDLELGEFQEAICYQATIYPDYDFSKGIAGVAEVLSDSVLDASGLHIGQAKVLLDEYRAEMFNYDYQVDCMIHEAFPEYTLEEISSWPVRRTMYFLSRAEWILTTLKGVPLSYIDEEIEQELAHQMQQEEPQAPPPPQTSPQPPQRQVRKELVEGPEPLAPKPPPPSAPEGGIKSEEELLAMLSGSGAKVSKPITDLSKETTPELSWFGYMDELKGEFD